MPKEYHSFDAEVDFATKRYAHVEVENGVCTIHKAETLSDQELYKVVNYCMHHARRSYFAIVAFTHSNPAEHDGAKD